MNHLERADAKFISEATDESQRRAAIEVLTSKRHNAFWAAAVGSAGFFLIFGLGAIHPTLNALGGVVGSGFTTVILWLNLVKLQSDLRLLKVVEHLRS
jgi:hypothetical protein